MDEIDVERGMMTGAMLLDCRLSQIRRPPAPDPDAVPGECVACGDDIPEARLSAIPGVIRCVDCQAAIERRRAA